MGGSRTAPAPRHDGVRSAELRRAGAFPTVDGSSHGVEKSSHDLEGAVAELRVS